MDMMHDPSDKLCLTEGWIDVFGNGLLKKKTLISGNVELEKPGNGQNVKVGVKIMHENGDVLMGRQRLSFTINKGDVIKALEICVPLMHVQETALILTDSKFCSGRAASEASEMKPGSRLLLEVQLLSVSGTLLEVKSLAEQLELISSEREKGNLCFQSKDYDLAFLCYSHALKIIESNSKEVIHPDDEVRLLQEKVKCYSNLAACHLNTGNLEEAFTCCDIVLQHEPQHCKALFRMGKVLQLQEKYFLSIKFLRKALQVEPTNREIEQEMKLVFDKWAEKSEGASNAKPVKECPLFSVEDTILTDTEDYTENQEKEGECEITTQPFGN